MGQKSIIVNTPNKKNHSDAQDWAAIFNGLYGGSTGILPIGSKLVVGVNDEFAIINDGVFSLSGHMLRVKEGTRQFLKLPETEVGKKRIAYVVAQYVVNAKMEDDVLEFAILAGEPDAINPLPPQVTTGNIDKGDRLNQSIIAELLIEGKKAEVNRYGKKAIILPSLSESDENLANRVSKNEKYISETDSYKKEGKTLYDIEKEGKEILDKTNQKGNLRVVTYNIFNLRTIYGIGVRHNYYTERMKRMLKGYGIHVYGIQEGADTPYRTMDSQWKDDNYKYINNLSVWRNLLPSVSYEQSIVSLLPFESETTGIFKDVGVNHQRGYNKVVVKKGNKNISIYNIHMEVESDVTIKQFNELYNITNGDDSDGIIIVGDFNFNLETDSNKYIGIFLQNGYKQVNAGKYKTHEYRKPLDEILYKGVSLVDSEMISSDLSDHKPLIAEFGVE